MQRNLKVQALNKICIIFSVLKMGAAELDKL